MDPLPAFGTAFGLVFLAEWGDKTQLAVVGLAARGRPRWVAAQATAAFAVLCALAAAVGAALAEALPLRALALAGGALFVALGLLGLRAEDDAPVRGPAFLVVFMAELGDKTQLALAALAATSGQPVAAGLGGFLALTLHAILAAAGGAWLASRVPARTLRVATAALFVAVGVVTLVLAL